jgi:hypothetical protein
MQLSAKATLAAFGFYLLHRSDVFLAELLGLHLHGTAVFRSSRISRAFPASAWTETGSLSAKNNSMAVSTCARAIANGVSFIKTF